MDPACLKKLRLKSRLSADLIRKMEVWATQKTKSEEAKLQANEIKYNSKNSGRILVQLELPDRKRPYNYTNIKAFKLTRLQSLDRFKYVTKDCKKYLPETEDEPVPEWLTRTASKLSNKIEGLASPTLIRIPGEEDQKKAKKKGKKK